MTVKTVKTLVQCKTVGWSINRYRLGHCWVSEMMLNVQSELQL